MRYRSNYRNNSLQHGDRSDHKYAYKKWVNGKWRYYYDDDDKPDKGFSIKRMGSFKTSTGYHIAPNDIRKSQNVSKDIYDNSHNMLYYKNEPVRNIAERKVSDLKKSSQKAINDGKKFVDRLAKKAKRTTKKIGKRIDKWLDK